MPPKVKQGKSCGCVADLVSRSQLSAFEYAMRKALDGFKAYFDQVLTKQKVNKSVDKTRFVRERSLVHTSD